MISVLSMVETDPTVALKIEAMNQQEFGNYLAVRQSAVAALPLGLQDYPAKKMALEQAIQIEKNLAEQLRSVAILNITAGAAAGELTQEKKTQLLIKSRQDLFLARTNFVYIKSMFLSLMTFTNLLLLSGGYRELRCGSRCAGQWRN